MRIEGGYGPAYYLAENKGELRWGERRPYAIIDIGYSNPLLSWSNRQPNFDDPVDAERPIGYVDADGCSIDAARPSSVCGQRNGGGNRFAGWATQFSLPVAFHLFWDPLSANAPIVNTDYEFGGEFSIKRALSARSEARGSIYLGHISTHVGDEYTISARDRTEPFPRINVSYEPLRLALGWRRYGSRRDSMYAYFPANRWDVVLNVESSCIPGFCGTDPYYNVEATENDNYAVPLTEEGIEASVSVVYSFLRKPISWPAPLTLTRAPSEFHIGAMVGFQNVFPYAPASGPVTATELPLKREPFVNAVVGRNFQRPNATLPSSAYIRYYRGPNPYGQLRNEKDFELISLGLTFSR